MRANTCTSSLVRAKPGDSAVGAADATDACSDAGLAAARRNSFMRSSFLVVVIGRYPHCRLHLKSTWAAEKVVGGNQQHQKA